MRAGLFCVDQESFPSGMAALPHLFLNEAHKGTQWAECRVYILIGSMSWLAMMSWSVLLWEDGTDILVVVIPWLSQCVLFWAHNPIILNNDNLKKEGKSENQWGPVTQWEIKRKTEIKRKNWSWINKRKKIERQYLWNLKRGMRENRKRCLSVIDSPNI